MRIIDIYRENLQLVGTDFIQTGENVLSRSLNAKSFTMADGSLLVYPAEKDKIQINLQLECSQSKALSLDSALHYGKLYFAGIHAGAHVSPTPTDVNYLNMSKNAFAGYPTGTMRTTQISADLYAIEIPLQMDFSDSVTVPGVLPCFGDEFWIDEISQPQKDYLYKKGVFHRKQVIFTHNSSISLSFQVEISGSSTAGFYCDIRSSFGVETLDDLTESTEYQKNLMLESGLNSFELTLTRVANRQCRPFRVQFKVYKFP